MARVPIHYLRLTFFPIDHPLPPVADGHPSVPPRPTHPTPCSPFPFHNLANPLYGQPFPLPSPARPPSFDQPSPSPVRPTPFGRTLPSGLAPTVGTLGLHRSHPPPAWARLEGGRRSSIWIRSFGRGGGVGRRRGDAGRTGEGGGASLRGVGRTGEGELLAGRGGVGPAGQGSVGRMGKGRVGRMGEGKGVGQKGRGEGWPLAEGVGVVGENEPAPAEKSVKIT